VAGAVEPNAPKPVLGAGCPNVLVLVPNRPVDWVLVAPNNDCQIR